ncbi:MAG: SAM-dependent methyltransferase [Archangiaceae bacterium]|nr:SAM-dependent methyltransferase [Archangiaceae bacterium]
MLAKRWCACSLECADADSARPRLARREGRSPPTRADRAPRARQARRRAADSRHLGVGPRLGRRGRSAPRNHQTPRARRRPAARGLDAGGHLSGRRLRRPGVSLPALRRVGRHPDGAPRQGREGLVRALRAFSRRRVLARHRLHHHPPQAPSREVDGESCPALPPALVRAVGAHQRARAGPRHSRHLSQTGAGLKRHAPKIPKGQRPARPVREDLVTQACLEAYGSVRHEGRLADRALDFTLRHKKMLYSNERRAVAERVYGLLRRERLVDFLLEQGSRGFDSISSTRKDLLRLTAVRVLAGEVPDLSALPADDRPALQRMDTGRAALDRLDPVERYAIEASLPDWLAARFMEELGDEAQAAAEAMNERAPLTARTNALKCDRPALQDRLASEKVTTRTTPLSPLGLHLDDRINAFTLQTFRDGFFELQDEGSQLLGMLVDGPPTKVVDACAGAGGKSLQIAAQMKNRGDLYALDIDPRRLEELKLRARRDGVHNVRIHLLPNVPDLAGKCDRVMVDAPCSGTGTLRRKPDARYRLTEASVGEYVAKQKMLLEQFAPMVKPGGRLIYGTCSILKEENEDVIASFLSAHPELEVMPAQQVLGEELGAKVCRGGFLRTYPHLHNTDGFFGAVLKKKK